MNPRFKFSAIATAIALTAISFVPTAAMAVPPISWQSGGIAYSPSECLDITMKVMNKMRLSPTKEGNSVKGFNKRTGIIVFCNRAKSDLGSCGGGSSDVTAFVASDDSNERDHLSTILSRQLFGVRQPGCL